MSILPLLLQAAMLYWLIPPGSDSGDKGAPAMWRSGDETWQLNIPYL